MGQKSGVRSARQASLLPGIGTTSRNVFAILKLMTSGKVRRLLGSPNLVVGTPSLFEQSPRHLAKDSGLVP
jgi:hypothetical protein